MMQLMQLINGMLLKLLSIDHNDTPSPPTKSFPIKSP